MSKICEFFEGTTVFLTGGTGFIGKLLIEKLLRVGNIKKIYVLVRSKKNKNEQERYAQIFDTPLFDGLKKTQPDYLRKVQLMAGDCLLDNLGLSKNDREILIAEVELVYHCAASVSFNQQLRTAMKINVEATLDLISLAKQMKRLQSFVYVSTAYANCPRKNIDEQFYEPPMSFYKLRAFLELFDDNSIASILPTWPNTYTYTKSVAEDMIKSEGVGLPLAIIRPSMIISTAKEPLVGWIDNFYGPIGVIVTAALGILHTLQCKPEFVADLIPADFVVNAMMAAAWNCTEKTISIYNCTSDPENNLTNGTYVDKVHNIGINYMTEKQVWHYSFRLSRYRWKHELEKIFYHIIPAYVGDFVMLCLRKKPIMVNGYKKLHKLLDHFAFFSNREWNFSRRNTDDLWHRMDNEDKQLFQFCMRDLNWEDTFEGAIIGGRTYLLKESMDTLPRAKRKQKILMVVHYVLLALLYYAIYKMLAFIVGLFYC